MKKVKVGMRLFCLLFALLPVAGYARQKAEHPDYDQPPFYYDWKGCSFEELTPAKFTVPPITKDHPRIMVTPAELERIKADVDEKKEPRYSAWLRVKVAAEKALQKETPPPYTGEDTLQFIGRAERAMKPLEMLVMAYLVEGDERYAEKAQDILLTWARATPLPGSVTTIRYRFPNAGMDVARGTVGFIYAYDGLYHALSKAERADVEKWFRSLLPVMYTGIKRWDSSWHEWWVAKETHEWMPAKNPEEPTYFNAQYYQNHLTAHAMGIMLVGYAVGDRGLVQFAVDCEQNPRDMVELINGMILMADKPPFYRDDPGPHQDGEIADRYRHVQGKGLGYAMLSFDQMLVITETLYRNGLDLYTYAGAYGETMELPFTFYADFWQTRDSSIKGGYYAGERPRGGSQAGRYEIGNLRYPGNVEITDFLRSVNRANSSMAGLLCCPTLICGQPLE